MLPTEKIIDTGITKKYIFINTDEFLKPKTSDSLRRFIQDVLIAKHFF